VAAAAPIAAGCHERATIMQFRRTITRVPLARFLAATGLAVAGTATVLAVATPAQAGVATTVVSAPAGTVVESATAFCPAGEHLTGGAGSVNLGGGLVTMTDVIPDLPTNSVTVWAHANSAAPPAFDVVAQAICAPGAPPANYVRVQSASPVNAAPTKTQVATCPANTLLLGTGLQLNAAFGQALPSRIAPNPAVNAVLGSATTIPGFAGNWQLITYGICGTPPNNVLLRTSAGPINNVNPKSWSTLNCPPGWLTTGGGAELTPNAAGNVVLRQMTTNIPQDTVTAGGVEAWAFPQVWGLTAHNICWQP
jgi:hypothetical protein